MVKIRYVQYITGHLTFQVIFFVLQGIIFALPEKERKELAVKYFTDGYNCAQSVALAFADLVDIKSETLAKLSSSFGGGMGRLREVCGAVSGMTMVAGFLSPCPTADDPAAKKANYALVQHFAEKFREQNGAIVCRTLLGLDHTKDEPTPSPRTAEYYKKRPCAELVGDAARIIAEWLLAIGY